MKQFPGLPYPKHTVNYVEFCYGRSGHVEVDLHNNDAAETIQLEGIDIEDAVADVLSCLEPEDIYGIVKGETRTTIYYRGPK